MIPSLVGLVIPVLIVLAPPAPPAPPITTGTLVTQMADMEGLTRVAPPGTHVVQFSSHDRRSKVPGGPDWFDNSDGFGSEPIPNFEGVVREPGADGIGEYLICDIQQPGAIVRTWTAAIRGTVRVYLDGAAEPVYDGPAADFMEHRASKIGGAAKATLEAALIPAFEQRYADFFPIAFAKSCRVVWTGNLKEVHFYQVQARLYPAGTAVRTFARGDVAEFRTEIAAAANRLLSPGEQTPGARQPVEKGESVVDPEETKEILRLEGAGAISMLEAKVEAEDMVAALRGAVLRIRFDGYQKPQVAAPIGDFFGAAPGVVAYETLPMSVSPDGTMRCRFVMPFQNGAVLTVENRTLKPMKVNLAAARTEYEWDSRSMHFRATWRADHDLIARGGGNVVDLPFLLAHAPGGGAYVGTAVYVMNPCPVPTAGGNWWGEGDEKVFVDDEAKASIFGTGSEDYFNYAWSECDIFQYPYFAQPICTGPETRGYITNSRWHVADAIPFDRSIAFYIELFAHTPTPHTSYTRIAYWYARPGAYDDAPALNDSDLRVPALPAWRVLAQGGAAGAVMFEAEDAAVASTGVQVISDDKYSAGKLVRFKGPTGALRIRCDKGGNQQVTLTCTSGPVGCSFVAFVDGKPLRHAGNERFEPRTNGFERLVNLRCDPIELSAGEHTLTISEIKGAAGVGVDFVWVKPVK
jgi:hypothetical protein